MELWKSVTVAGVAVLGYFCALYVHAQLLDRDIRIHRSEMLINAYWCGHEPNGSDAQETLKAIERMLLAKP